MNAKQRYDALRSDRSQYLDTAREAADLTLPYLIRGEEDTLRGPRHLPTPWQSIGAKGVVTLASKLMLALLPPQTSFFKLQVNESEIGADFPKEARTELDISFAKIERVMMADIAASSDRVVVHQALKHLVVAGNALVYMGKKGLRMYPLNRYVVDRDGDGNVLEIVTKETVNKDMLPDSVKVDEMQHPGDVSQGSRRDEVDVYTHILRDNNRFIWHQEYDGKMIPKSEGKSPIDTNPWLPLRFNTVDGEMYGRGRVEEFMGDLKSLEGLTQAVVEGSAAAAKVVFLLSPSATTKPASLAAAGNGAIVQGRPEDVTVVQVGKTADFATAYQMIGTLEQRLSDAFLILNIRQSERTTAEEVRTTQLELEQQLGGLFSLLTEEFLVPYLNRKLSVAERQGLIPRLPKDIVKPTIVAGVNALGRGADAQSLAQFLGTIAQTVGPEAIQQYVAIDEVIKRLAAAQGIETLNLVKSAEEVQAEQQQQQQQIMALEQSKVEADMMKAPMFDPSKNPKAEELARGGRNETNAAAEGSQEAQGRTGNQA